MAKKYDVTYTIGADDQTAAGLQSAIKNLTSPIDRIQKQWTGFVRASGINAYIELAQKGFRAITFAGEQYAKFLEQKDRELAFQNLAESVGTNTQKIVASLKKASHETLTFDEILDSASRALLEGLKPEQLEKLMEVARAATRVTGHDLRTAFDNLSHAVATNSERLARSEGVIVDARKGHTIYQGILEKSIELNKKFGDSTNSYSERFKQAKTSIADSAKGIKDSILNISTPAVVQSLETTAGLLEKLRDAMKLPVQQNPEDIIGQRGGLIRTKPMGEGAQARAAWEIGAEEIARTEKNLEEIDWGKWAEDYAKTVDRSAQAILNSMKELDERLKGDVMVNGKSLEALVDKEASNILDNMEANSQAAQNKLRSTTSFQLAESFSEGFSYSASRGVSDALVNAFSGEKTEVRNVLRAFGMSMARIIFDSLADMAAKKMQSFLMSLLINAGTAAVTSSAGSVAGGGGATGNTSGGGGVSGGGGYGTASSPQIVNQYYITDDAMLEKRIDAAMTKSMRQNRFRQQIKATK